MQAAVSVNKLCKLYRIGGRSHGQYRTLRETIGSTLSRPWRSGAGVFRSLRHSRRAVESRSASSDEDLWALKDVSFDIQPGEVVGVIGRNGAGKSTVLKILSRITEPSSGRVELRGRVGSLLEVGTGFHPELTGRENIFLNGAICGMSRREICRKFDEIVAFSEIERFLDTPVKRYSSGMFVRLAFAVAAHMEPEILLVDEVLAVGDMEFQKKCLGKMGEVSRSGRTVLFVSHNMATVLNLCEKAAVFAQGRLIHLGSCEEGVKLYVNQCSAAETSEAELAEHPNRRPGLTPILGRVRMLDAAGNPTTKVLGGAPVMIEVSVIPGCRIAEPHIAIGFDDAMGIRVFTAATYLTDTAPPSLRRTGSLVCRLDELALAPGRYSLTLNAGPHGALWSDMIDQALWFEVLPSNYYGNGKLPNSEWGRVLVRSQWSATGA
jgi:lipopolysaccharide transport system ATP-binding protein